MRCASALLFALCPFGGAQAQDVPLTALRHDEDWSVLRDAPPTDGDWRRPLKYRPLDEEGRIWLTLGGEARTRYEAYANNLWSQSPAPDDGYLWIRAVPHADLHAGPARLFVQGIAGYARGVGGGKGPVDETGADLLQGFADIRLPAGEGGSLTLRAGRQLLALGSERLVGARYGTNVPQSFDGIHAIFEHGGLRVDAFRLRPVDIGPDNFDDATSRTRRLHGFYATIAPAENIGIDLYWLGYGNETACVAAGTGHEQRDTLGLRFSGQRGPLGWNWEAVRQNGRFDGEPIRAWSVASETSWHFTGLALQPRLRLRANVVSGDRDGQDRVLGTFNAMFPKGYYFGELSPIGPANIVNVHPGVELTIVPRMTLTFAGVAYWRESGGDGIYGMGGSLLRPPGDSASRFIGREVEAAIGWQANEIVSLSASAAIFAAGGFIRETGPARAIRMAAFEARARF